MITIETRACSLCSRTFPLEWFRKDAKFAGGRTRRCKICKSSADRAAYQKGRHKSRPKKAKPTIAQRFEAMCKKGTPRSCWPWTGQIHANVPKITIQGRTMSAIRVAWWLKHESQAPRGRQVRRVCGSKTCVNPAHLCLGTAAPKKLAAGRRKPLDITSRPESAAIMRAVATAYGVRAEDLTIRRTQGVLPYSSPIMRARRIAIIALYKQWENAKAVATLFGRHASSIWTVLNFASDDEHRYAGEIVSRVP